MPASMSGQVGARPRRTWEGPTQPPRGQTDRPSRSRPWGQRRAAGVAGQSVRHQVDARPDDDAEGRSRDDVGREVTGGRDSGPGNGRGGRNDQDTQGGGRQGRSGGVGGGSGGVGGRHGRRLGRTGRGGRSLGVAACRSRSWPPSRRRTRGPTPPFPWPRPAGWPGEAWLRRSRRSTGNRPRRPSRQPTLPAPWGDGRV